MAELTREQIQADAVEAQKALEALTKEYQGIARTLERERKDATIDQLVLWVGQMAVISGNVQADGTRIGGKMAEQQKIIDSTQTRINIIEFAENAVARETHKAVMRDVISPALTLLHPLGAVIPSITCPVDPESEFGKMGIESVIFTPVRGDTGYALSDKMTGAGVPKSQKARASTSNGSARSHGAGTVNGVEYSSASKAYLTLREAKDGKAPSPANHESCMRWLTHADQGFAVTGFTA